jgi:hypothetical protein
VHNRLQIRLKFLTRQITPWQLTHLRSKNDLSQEARMTIVTRETPGQKERKYTPTDVPVVVSDRDYDTEPVEDEYMITVDIWQDLPKVLRKMVKGLIARGDLMRTMAFRRMGMTISVLKDMIERTKGKVVAPRDKRLQ